MSLALAVFEEKSRLKSLLDHFSTIEDPREAWRIAHPLAEVLLLVVCGTTADCDDYEAIAAWGATHLTFLRRYLPFHHGVPGGRWLTQLMNRINPALFSAVFTAWVRETWPDRPNLIAVDGKTSRRSHDRAADKGPLHLVPAFAATSRLVLGQEAAEGKANELSAIPVLIDRPAEGGGLKGALVSVDAIATNAKIAQTIADADGDYLLAVKANQPSRPRQGPWPHRTADRQRHPRRRLAQRRPALPRRVSPPQRRHDHPRAVPHRACRLLSVRDPLLHLLGHALGRAGGSRRARPLGHRKPAALGARRCLRRRPVPIAQRSWRKKHGHRQTLRHQPDTRRNRPEKHQAATQNRRMGPKPSGRAPRSHNPLTRIRCPANFCRNLASHGFRQRIDAAVPHHETDDQD